MTNKHTPAPWVLSKDTHGVLRVWDKEGNPICSFDTNSYIDRKEKEKNIHLITSAPELLEALESIAHDIHMRPMVWLEIAKTAIKKARGE